MATAARIAALRSFLAQEPYASMSAEAALAALHTTLVQGRRVPFSEIVDELIDSDNLIAVQSAALDSENIYHAACRKALASMEAANRYGSGGALFTSGSPHLILLNNMVDESGDAGPVTKATRDAIIAKGLIPLSEAEGLAWAQLADVQEAMS